MTITISASGIALDGPLVAGEKVAVSVSGLSFTAEDKPTLALLARFPDALLASAELAESETAGTWTGELDTATKQTALFFATARADERRDAALELVSGRVSLARLTVPMANSALCPKPDGSPFASPVYVPVPGPPGQGGDPYDQAPQMDGEASAGSADEYARGDHRHPTDETRQAVIGDLAAIRSGAAAGATAVQPSALSAYRTAAAQDAIDGGKLNATGLTNNNGQLGALDFVTRYSFGFDGGKFITAPENSGAALTDNDIADSSSALGGALAAKANSSALAAVATTGDYADLNNKPTIPAAQVNADWNAASGVAQILNKPTIPDVSGKADSASIAPAFSSSSTYAVGDYCTHEGLLYKCTTAVSTAGAWDAANWTAVAVTDEMGGGGGGGNLPYDAEVEYIESSSTDTAYIDTGIAANTIVSAYGMMMTPASGQRFYFGARVEAWSGNLVTAWNSGQSGFRMSYGDNLNAKIITGNTTAWTNCGFIGTTVFYNGITESYTQSGTVTSGNAYLFSINDNGSPISDPTSVPLRIRSFRIETANGIARDFIAVRKDGIGCLYDRISQTFFYNAGTGSFAYGADVENLYPSLRYAFASPTPSVSGTTATVACEDRAINDFTVATGITSLTITPPAAVTGRARDFFCRVTLTDSSLPTVTLSGGTIDIGASDVAGMTQGVNLLMFTEISSGHWLASRRSAS